MMRAILLGLGLFLAAPALMAPALADGVPVTPQPIIEWKSVFGRIEPKETIPARARIGGTIVELTVSEGDMVAEGQQIARIKDDKIDFQIASLDAQIEALRAQLDVAETELRRGETLVERGVATVQRLDQLRSAVDVLRNQIDSTEAQRAVAVQQAEEGRVLAPASGRVLTVPVTRGGVIQPGEPVATIGVGGFYLRLSVPERHAPALGEGDTIRIALPEGEASGRIVKLYPLIEGGRVTADVEVEGLDTDFVNSRVLVQLPVGSRQALLVPENAIVTRSGIDFVTVAEGGARVERAVIPGERLVRNGQTLVEILTGLNPGEEVIVP